ncbi:MAG: spore germination protein [Lutispora sp.]|jgi:spore germination protein KA
MSAVTVSSIKQKLNNNYSIIYRSLEIHEGNVEIIYDDTMVNIQFISEFVISPILNKDKIITDLETLEKEVITSATIGSIKSLDEAVNHILSGAVVLIFDFLDEVIYCSAPGYAKRSLDIPPTGGVFKGPREGFNEILQDNISAVKRRIKDPNLKLVSTTVGKKSKTKVVIAYIEGSAPDDVVKFITKRIDDISMDYVIYANIIQEKLTVTKSSFNTLGFTEKPDVAAAKLGEGRVAIFVDGTPLCITAPYFFIENFHTADDYTLNKYVSPFGVLLRWGAFLSSTLLPGIYISLFAYHFNLVPYILLFNMAASRSGVPFPLIVEVILMLIFFQLLREAGIRLPQPIGQTLSIVGALILGDAAVGSGFASQITIMIVALTSIASFLVPTLSVSIFYWNIIVILFSGLLGLPGFYIAFILLCSHLSSLTSCGYPYLYPLGTLNTFKYKDIIFRGDFDEISHNIFIKDDAE